MKLKSTSLKFRNTSRCFDAIVKEISAGNYESGGAIFEDFTTCFHLYPNNNLFGYVNIWNTNQPELIPDSVKKDLGYKLFEAFSEISNGTSNFYAIDKIAFRRDGKYDFHQDKAHKDRNKSEGVGQIDSMVALASLCKAGMVENLILNTMSDSITDTAGLFTEFGNLLTFTYSDFCPDPDHAEAVEEDTKFWKWIQNSIKQDTVLDSNSSFVYRNHVQKDYEDSIISSYLSQVSQKGRFKGFALAVGATGKSVLDPRSLARIEQESLPDNTKELFDDIGIKLSVAYWHSSETLPNNGWEFTKRRRELGCYDYVIVVSGTSIHDGDSLSAEIKHNKFPQVIVSDPTDISDVIVEIEKAKKLGYTNILLKALYHHSELIYNVECYYKHKIDNFEMFFVYRDECDWPSMGDSRYRYAFDHTAHIEFGSTGTETKGGNNTLATDRISVHGPRVFDYRWTQAEQDNLVKPLRLVSPSISMSGLSSCFPDLVNKDGEIDLLKKLTGANFVDIDGDYPTVEFILQLATIAVGMYDEPNAKRHLCFSGRVKTNRMAELNWQNVCNKILPKDRLAKEIRDIHWEVLNDNKMNRATIKDRSRRIARAKKYDRYIIASCRLLNRGYNDKEVYNNISRLKHNSGFHLSDKSARDQAQEIWRFIRLDNRIVSTDGIYDPDPYSYYIASTIVNDINPNNAHYMDTNMKRVLNVLMGNKRILDELVNKVSSSSRGRRNKSKQRVPVHADLDLASLPNLITHLKVMSNGAILENIAADAHTWLITEFMKLANPNTNVDKHLKNNVWNRFFALEEFKPVWDNKLENLKLWQYQFFYGKRKYSGWGSMNPNIMSNVVAWKQHVEEFNNWAKSKNLKAQIVSVAEEWFDNDYMIHTRQFGLHDLIIESVPELGQLRLGWARKRIIDPITDRLKKKQISNFSQTHNLNPTVVRSICEQAIDFSKTKDYTSINRFFVDFSEMLNKTRPKNARRFNTNRLKGAFYYDKTWHKVVSKELSRQLEDVFDKIVHVGKWVSIENQILEVAKQAIDSSKDYIEALVDAGIYPAETLKTRKINRGTLLKIRKLYTKDYQQKVLNSIKSKNRSEVQKTVVVDLHKKIIFPHTVEMVKYYSKLKGKQLDKGFANGRLSCSEKNPDSSFYGRYKKFPVKGQSLSYYELFSKVKEDYSSFTVID